MSVTRKTNVARATRLIVSALLACIVPLAAVAAPNIDGRIDPTEGYTEHDIDFILEGGDVVEGGRLLIHVDDATGDVSIALEQPTDLVDNSYGANAVGWGAMAETGKNHKFRDLVGSDKALFLFSDGEIDAVQLDFLYETAKGSGVYDAGVEPGKDSYVAPPELMSNIEASSSLDYNINTLGYDLTEDSPETVSDESYELVPGSAYTGWLFEVIYEMRIDGEVFEDAGGFRAEMLDVSIVHDSPNKLGKNAVETEIEYTPSNGPTGPVPEPATMLAVCLGAGGLGGYLRRRR